ncbi:SDR family NAD(P)-dependent oxidoreductase [Nocardioides panacisoli]|uniref:3-oxoacyl-[acyl-carrier-protein] reductase n=1 Tax=Nocardioides panacisoli TaxID=627624 RepID=A0ABP7ISF2_9ACTN
MEHHERGSSLLDLTGRTAIVTGGAMGIGKSIATRLASAGAAVVVADADGEAAALTAKELHDDGLQALAVTVDVSDETAVRRLGVAAVAWSGRIDVLVNNAGIFPTIPVMDMSPEQFRRVIDVNLEGVYLCSRMAAQQMIEQGDGGRIVNVTSIDALHPSSVGLAHYDASKHGAWGFTKNLALELAPHGIAVNAIAPGAIATPGVEHMQAVPGVDPEVMLRTFLARIPMGRMGVPDDIGKVALFLVSPMADYMTGAQVVVDGGVLLA